MRNVVALTPIGVGNAKQVLLLERLLFVGSAHTPQGTMPLDPLLGKSEPISKLYRKIERHGPAERWLLHHDFNVAFYAVEVLRYNRIVVALEHLHHFLRFAHANFHNQHSAFV